VIQIYLISLYLDETFYRQTAQIYHVRRVNDLSDAEKVARDSIFKKSDQTFLKNRQAIIGYDFNSGIKYESLFDSFAQQGFQATNFARAIEIINLMIEQKKLSTTQTNCTIFLGYTSNMVSFGNRDIIRYLVQHKKVDCLVTTAGGIEEDIIKCFASTYNGDFNLNGVELRQKAISRIGNLLIANDNYCSFEQFLMPILDHMLEEQTRNNVNWTPSKMIEYMGKEINNEQSIYYWAWKNNIPVFCPAITDGSIGDLLFFHSLQNTGLRIDIVEDIKKLNTLSLNSLHTGCLILGGGIVKHHILNANAMRSGANYAVIINTAMEYAAVALFQDSGIYIRILNFWSIVHILV
jgi:deoxyhypusine synthase